VKNFLLAEDQSPSPEGLCSADIGSCWWCPCCVGIGVWLWGHAHYMDCTGRQYEHWLSLKQISLIINKMQNVWFLTFICPCTASISLKYNQKDAKFSRSIYFY